MTDTPPERTAEKKAKSKILDVLYGWYLEKRSDDWVYAEISRKNLPKMSQAEWWAMKQFFREREMSHPNRMQQIRQKIGKAC